MTPEERARILPAARDIFEELKRASRHRRPDDQAFREALTEHARWPLATGAIILLNATVLILMGSASGALGDPKTLLDWGASIGPRTTNGEWWRLGTSVFVHAGLIQVLVCAAGLIQVGVILERLVGRWTFLLVYGTAGIFGSLVNLSAHPATPGFGSSAAIFGLYGLAIAYAMWHRFHPSAIAIPTIAVRRLLPAVGVFALYSLFHDGLDASANVIGLSAGLAAGLALLTGASDSRPVPRRLAAVLAAALLMAGVSARPLRGFANIWPELERIVAVEESTARDFQTADQQFNKRRLTADALAGVIDQKILPELQAADARLRAIQKVPKEHQPLVADAEEYLRLRSDSWRLRADGLRKIEQRDLQSIGESDGATGRRQAEARHRANLATIGNAEGKARASLTVLQRIKTRLHDELSPA